MEQEEQVLVSLAVAFNEFIKLESQHPDELLDFVEGIHKCQAIIALRFARASRPDLFPIKK